MVSTYPLAASRSERPVNIAGHSIAWASLNECVCSRKYHPRSEPVRKASSKNSGGRIRSAAIGGLIEAMFSSVNAFLVRRKRDRTALNDAIEVEFPAFGS
jgi:hypothetical protein